MLPGMAGIGGLIASAAPPAAWSPSDISNATIWLDAGQGVTLNGSSQVTTWTDQIGGLGFTASSTVGGEPTVASINGLPAIFCFAGGASFTANYSETGAALSAFMVATLKSTSSNWGRLFSFANSASAPDGGQAIMLRENNTSKIYAERSDFAATHVTVGYDTPFIAGFNMASSDSYFDVDGTLYPDAGGVSTTFAIDRLRLRKNYFGTDTAYGLTAEVLITSGAISTDDRQKLEGYWAHRYGITLPSGHPYELAPPA